MVGDLNKSWWVSPVASRNSLLLQNKMCVSKRFFLLRRDWATPLRRWRWCWCDNERLFYHLRESQGEGKGFHSPAMSSHTKIREWGCWSHRVTAQPLSLKDNMLADFVLQLHGLLSRFRNSLIYASLKDSVNFFNFIGLVLGFFCCCFSFCGRFFICLWFCVCCVFFL